MDKATNIERSNYLSTFVREYTILIALSILVIMLSLFLENFMSAENLVSVLKQASIIGLAACAMTMVMLFGGVDLSIASTISCSGVAAVFLLDRVSLFPAILLTLLLGACIGLVNGIILSMIDGDTSANFVVTLGMATFLQGTILVLTGGNLLYVNEQAAFKQIGQGMVGFIPTSTFWLLGVGALLQILILATPFGRRLRLSGGNRTAARYSGINANMYRIITFIISGICAAMAGIVLASRVGSANPIMGKGYEFDAIAASVIGGNSMFGGSGAIHRAFIGVLLLIFISNALNLINIPNELQTAIKGLVIFISVWVDMPKKAK